MATRPLSGAKVAEPFVKMLGGKRQLLGELMARIPDSFTTYYEPFVGGGALFFHLHSAFPGRFQGAVLGDDNFRLVRTYRALRDNAETVIGLLRQYKEGYERGPRELYMQTRALSRFVDGGLSAIDSCRFDAVVAAWFIFLNKTSFNGLMRVNQKNEMNADFGKYENPAICDPVRLRACAAALNGVAILFGDFEQTLADARPGDFVYLDPPYVPISKTASFTNYTSEGAKSKGMLAFQTRVRDVALGLKRRGVRVLVSNSDTPLVRQLYAGEFEVTEVRARRVVNRDPTKRGSVGELLMR